MNLNRKTEMQERRILYLEKQIDTLKKENETLRSENQELLDKESRYLVQLNMVDELIDEFTAGIAEMNTVKEQYKQAIYEAKQMKKDFTKKFKPLIKQLRSIT